MIKISNVLLFFLFLAAHSEAAVRGALKNDLQKIQKIWGDVDAQHTSLSTFDEIIRFLMLTESYSSVELQSNQTGSYDLLATPLKSLKEIDITGNIHFTDDEILAALGLKAEAKISRDHLTLAGNRLKEFYGNKGYLNTIVSFDLTDADIGQAVLHVRIRERPPCLIKDIVFKVQNEELKSRLYKRTKKLIDKNFTNENLQEVESIVIDYLRENRFIHSKLTQSEAQYNNSKTAVALVYELSDPYSYEIILSGNIHYSPTQIIKNIKFDQIYQSGSDPAQTITQMVRNYYNNTGFYHTRIYSEEKKIEKTFVKQVHLYITEGPRVRIKSFEIVGRISKPSREYINFIKKNSSPAIADNLYVRDDIESGLKNLIVHLNNQGYLKAKVLPTRVEFNEGQDLASLFVNLDEGPLTQLAKINFYGVKSFTDMQLLNTLEIKNGTPLHLNDLERSIEKLKKFYYDRGFLEMKIQNENSTLIEYDEKGLQASLHFRITEGPQIYVMAIKLEGNTFTKDYVLTREASINVGDLLTPDLLQEAQKRLDKLGLFGRVDLLTLEANTNISHRTLIIRVTERNPGVFKFGAGVTNKRDLTARGFALLSYNNLWGTARAVSLRATIENNLVRDNYLEYEVTAGYLEPFLFNKRLRGRALYTRSEKIIEDSNDTTLLATDRINFIIERDLTSRIKFSWLFWGYDSVEKFDVPNTGPIHRESRQEIAYLGPSLDIDYTDNLFMPTMGTYTRLDAEYAAPELGSSDDIQFVRTQGRVTHHLRVAGSRKYVWANSFQSGYEKNLNTNANSGVPLSFAFFLGGQNTVRGYSGTSGDRIPDDRDHSIDEHKNQLVIPNESTFYLVKSELRFPLWVEPFGGVLFYDAGQVNIQNHFGDENAPHKAIGELKQSVGVGVRINTPVGPISLDYARKIIPLKEYESPDQWHLSIGTF